MHSRRLVPLLLFSAICSVELFAQSVRPTAPIPNDPLELATGPVDLADTPAKRTAGLALLEQARQNFNLRAPGSAPYDIKVSFNAIGTSQYAGPGEMEEMSNTANTRWTAHLGTYSQVRVFAGGTAYDVHPGTYLPLRLQMLRQAIFWPISGRFPNAFIRTAPAIWKGAPVSCLLFSRAGPEAATLPGRRWQEEEFCIDPKTGLLHTYSVAPGIYNVYDYSGAIQFHGRLFPRQLSVMVAGAMVLQGQVDSLTDLAPDPKLFEPGEDMNGPAIVIRPPERFSQIGPNNSAMVSGPIQPVIVLAVLNIEGKVLEAEALQTANAVLAEAALELVKSTQYQKADEPIQREVFIKVLFAANPNN